MPESADQAPEFYVPVIAPARRPRLGAEDVRPRFAAAEIKCASIPIDTPKASNTSYTLETDQAAKLGISYIGTADAEASKKMKVFIREFTRYATCESTDGKATLLYGAVWRATVLIDEVDASGKVNFAVVAASATLRNVAVQVSITHDGFDPSDRIAIDEASNAAMKETASGLNVSSFVKFSEQVEKAIDAASRAKVMQPLQLIGVKTHDTDVLLDAVARTFALSHIARGHGCLEPIGAFPIKSDHIEHVIRGTYDALSTKPCDAGDAMVQLAAQRLLNGIKVR